jgi:hypothetical protein
MELFATGRVAAIARISIIRMIGIVRIINIAEVIGIIGIIGVVMASVGVSVLALLRTTTRPRTLILTLMRMTILGLWTTDTITHCQTNF